MAHIEFNLWTCEFCYDICQDFELPKEWTLVLGCAVCPKCQIRVDKAGGYNKVRGGEYAYGKEDPRLKLYNIGEFSVGELVKMKYGNSLYPSPHDIFRIDRFLTHPRFGGEYPEVGVIVTLIPCPFCGQHNKVKARELQGASWKYGMALGWLEKIR